jgi:CheY-like chemotaxis protein
LHAAAQKRWTILSKGSDQNRAPGNPALLLLDLQLPKIDGTGVRKTICLTPFRVDIRVIVLSASNLDTDLRRTQSLGVASYLVKPVE